MANLPQNSDRLSLEETLAAMERLGTSGAYLDGYRAGFKRQLLSTAEAGDHVVTNTQCACRRGYVAGVAARERGAHDDALPRMEGAEPLLYGDGGFLYGGAS